MIRIERFFVMLFYHMNHNYVKVQVVDISLAYYRICLNVLHSFANIVIIFCKILSQIYFLNCLFFHLFFQLRTFIKILNWYRYPIQEWAILDYNPLSPIRCNSKLFVCYCYYCTNGMFIFIIDWLTTSYSKFKLFCWWFVDFGIGIVLIVS